jgi:LysM repeat protein
MAPAALLAAILAVALVVSGSTGGETDSASPPAAGTTATGQTQTGARTETQTPTGEAAPAGTGTGTTPATGGETYTVEAGDSLASIAAASGTTVEELQELNPDVDPQSLRVGQTIQLP